MDSPPVISLLGTNMNRNRIEIFGVIKSNPGAHKSFLCRETNLSWGTVHHHVSKLESWGLIQSRRIGSLRVFVAADEPLAQMGGALLFSPGARRVLTHLRQEGVASPKSIQKALAIGRVAVRRYLDVLLAEELICTDGEYHPRFWAREKPADADAPPVRVPTMGHGAAPTSEVCAASDER